MRFEDLKFGKLPNYIYDNVALVEYKNGYSIFIFKEETGYRVEIIDNVNFTKRNRKNVTPEEIDVILNEVKKYKPSKRKKIYFKK